MNPDVATGIIIGLSIAVLFMILAVVERGPSGRNESRDFNRINGKFRVRYSDGRVSTPLCHDVARDYAEIFGGKVIPKGNS